MELEYKGYNIAILHDEDSSPKDFDNFGHILTSDNRYWTPDITDKTQFNEERIRPGTVYLPVYILVHSGTTVSTKPFNDPWDSAQVGFIYATTEEVRKEFDGDRDKALAALESTIKLWNQYLQGDVHCYVVTDSKGEQIDSCGGIYGEDQAVEEAKQAIDYLEKSEGGESVVE